MFFGRFLVGCWWFSSGFLAWGGVAWVLFRGALGWFFSAVLSSFLRFFLRGRLWVGLGSVAWCLGSESFGVLRSVNYNF